MWTLSCGSLYWHVGFCFFVLYRVSFSVLFSSSPSCCLFFLFHLLINWFFLSLSLCHSLSPTCSLILPLTYSHTDRQTLTCLFSVAGMGQCALPRGWLHALVSLRSPLLAAPYLPLFRCGTMCTTKGSDVYLGIPPLSFWCSPLLRARRGIMRISTKLGCTPWRPPAVRPVPWFLYFCVIGMR